MLLCSHRRSDQLDRPDHINSPMKPDQAGPLLYHCQISTRPDRNDRNREFGSCSIFQIVTANDTPTVYIYILSRSCELVYTSGIHDITRSVHDHLDFYSSII
jgi:hypothetical protein